MTREEAIENTPTVDTTKRTEKHTETHTCDYISRQEVVESFTQLWDCVGEITDRDEWEDVCKTTANELPSAQRKGKWIVYALDDFRGRRTGNFRIVCQICGFNRTIWHKDTFPKFCENCGAEMKGEEDESR